MRTLAFAASLALTACTATPVPYHSQNEIPQGPGLLTGAEGAFVLRADASAPRAAPAPGDAGNAKGPGSPAR